MNPEKVGAKMRKPEALLPGKPYRLSSLINEVSQFKDKHGNEVKKLIAIYEDFKVKFYTYLPKDFDNPSEAKMEEYKNALTEGDGIRIVFYGKVDRSHIMDLLMPGETVDEDKRESVKLIESCQSQYQSPVKRGYESSDDQSPAKKQKEQ